MITLSEFVKICPMVKSDSFFVRFVGEEVVKNNQEWLINYNVTNWHTITKIEDCKRIQVIKFDIRFLGGCDGSDSMFIVLRRLPK